MQQLITKRNIIISIISLGFLFLIWLLTFISTHGIVDTSTLSGYKLVYQIVDTEEPISISEKKSGLNFLPTGKYQLKITRGQEEFSKTITVGRFLSVLPATLNSYNQATATHVVANNRDMFVQSTTDNYTSFNVTSTDLLKHRVGDVFALNNRIDRFSDTGVCSRMSLYQDKVLCLYSSAGDAELYQLAMIDPISNVVTIIPTTVPITESTSLIVGEQANGSFVLKNNKTVYYFKDITTSPVRIESTKTIANGESAALISTSQDTLAIVSGNDYLAPNSEASSEPLGSDYSVAIYSTQTGKIKATYDLKNQNPISSFKLRPQGDMAALTTVFGLRITTLASNETVFATMLDTVNTTAWFDDSAFIYSANAKGIYKVSIDQRTSYPLFSVSVVNISSFYIYHNKIYVNAFYKNQLAQEQQGFIVDPQVKSNDNNAVYQTVPHETNDYKIAIDGSTISVLSTVIEGNISDGSGGTASIDTLSQARNYLSASLKDSSKYTITSIY